MGASETDKSAEEDEKPQHEVGIGYVFAVGKFPITFAQWDAATREGAVLPTPPVDRGAKRGKRPVVQVSWENGTKYAEWMNTVCGLNDRFDAYRLPSEAEWEYACRAGTTTPYSFGESITNSQAIYGLDFQNGPVLNGARERWGMPVGSYPANAFGLHDMHGNVWEWCQDRWHESYAEPDRPNDGTAWLSGASPLRIIRGGSWLSKPSYLRSSYRAAMMPSYKNITIGFRLARTLAVTEEGSKTSSHVEPLGHLEKRR